MEAIVLAGGAGTRIRSLNLGVPKPMADVAGRPFLEYALTYLQQQKVSAACLAVHYGAEAVMRHFGDAWGGLRLVYSVEERPLGTGGAIRAALERVGGADVLVINGDTLFEVPLHVMWHFHGTVSADITVAVHHEKYLSRYGRIIFDKQRRIVRFSEKTGGNEPGWINGGVYIVRRGIIMDAALPRAFSFERDILEARYEFLREFCLISDGYFVDIGVPEDLERAQQEFGKGIPKCAPGLAVHSDGKSAER